MRVGSLRMRRFRLCGREVCSVPHDYPPNRLFAVFCFAQANDGRQKKLLRVNFPWAFGGLGRRRSCRAGAYEPPCGGLADQEHRKAKRVCRQAVEEPAAAG